MPLTYLSPAHIAYSPSAEVREETSTCITFIARDRHGDISGVSEFRGFNGYDTTALAIVECAKLLLHQRDKLPMQGGVLTPVSAFGQPLMDSLTALSPDVSFRECARG